jgi:hypothetical protein
MKSSDLSGLALGSGISDTNLVWFYVRDHVSMHVDDATQTLKNPMLDILSEWFLSLFGYEQLE